jgi:hypothetical protein
VNALASKALPRSPEPGGQGSSPKSAACSSSTRVSGPAATRAYQKPVASIDVLSASTQFVYGIGTWMKLSLDSLASQYQTFGQLGCTDDEAVTAGKYKANAVEHIASGFTDLNRAIAAEP